MFQVIGNDFYSYSCEMLSIMHFVLQLGKDLPKLQMWLQYTHEVEKKNYNKKHIDAEKQLRQAKEAVR